MYEEILEKINCEISFREKWAKDYLERKDFDIATLIEWEGKEAACNALILRELKKVLPMVEAGDTKKILSYIIYSTKETTGSGSYAGSLGRELIEYANRDARQKVCGILKPVYTGLPDAARLEFADRLIDRMYYTG